MAVLIAFYSRAGENYFGGVKKYIQKGNTEKAAEMIEKLTKGTLLKINQKEPYSSDYDECIAEAKKDKQMHARPKLLNLPDSIQEYDEIYLGYPNYWGTMPMAVYTFLEAYDFSGKIIHPFCTHEGSGLANTEENIKRIVSGAVVTKGLSIVGSQVEENQERIEKWVYGL